MTTMEEGRDYIIVTAACCREWPIAIPARVGKCGYCGEIPVVLSVSR